MQLPRVQHLDVVRVQFDGSCAVGDACKPARLSSAAARGAALLRQLSHLSHSSRAVCAQLPGWRTVWRCRASAQEPWCRLPLPWRSASLHAGGLLRRSCALQHAHQLAEPTFEGGVGLCLEPVSLLLLLSGHGVVPVLRAVLTGHSRVRGGGLCHPAAQPMQHPPCGPQPCQRGLARSSPRDEFSAACSFQRAALDLGAPISNPRLRPAFCAWLLRLLPLFHVQTRCRLVQHEPLKACCRLSSVLGPGTRIQEAPLAHQGLARPVRAKRPALL